MFLCSLRHVAVEGEPATYLFPPFTAPPFSTLPCLQVFDIPVKEKETEVVLASSKQCLFFEVIVA